MDVGARGHGRHRRGEGGGAGVTGRKVKSPERETPPSKKRRAPDGTPVKEAQVAPAEQPRGGSAPSPAEKPGEKKLRAKYGTQLTFAGRRPPKDPEKRKLFDDIRMEYYKQKEQDRKMGRSGRIYSENKYHKFMKLKMQELATAARNTSTTLSPPERMRLAAAAWSEHKLGGAAAWSALDEAWSQAKFA